MNVINFLREVGIDIAILIAGLSGGLVSLRKDEKMTVWQKIFTVMSGGLIATYLTPLLIPLSVKLFGKGLKIEYGLGFVVGYMGLKAIEFIISKFLKNKNNDSI